MQTHSKRKAFLVTDPLKVLFIYKNNLHSLLLSVRYFRSRSFKQDADEDLDPRILLKLGSQIPVLYPELKKSLKLIFICCEQTKKNRFFLWFLTYQLEQSGRLGQIGILSILIGFYPVL